MNIPTATYRLQFSSQFTFQQATAIVDYLHRLGISYCYASPLFKAKAGSKHGYDVVDHTTFNPEIGTEEEFEAFVKKLRDYQMGLIVDIVPNHMYIFDLSNRWWRDILENCPASPFADYFDIDWNPPRAQLKNKVLLPILEQQYGTALENKTIQVSYKEGVFLVELPFLSLPTNPSTWTFLLEPIAHEPELQSIVTAIKHLPPITTTAKERIEEREREKEVIKQRLAVLTEQNNVIEERINHTLQSLNGTKGDPKSFDQLENFVNAQPYRLCFWRVANDEINYRRFFDILGLAGINANQPKVFEAIHSLVRHLIEKKLVDGLRIDHIDGLWDPEQYLSKLKKEYLQVKPLYIVAEKILTGNEKLLQDWLLNGTVGYDFLNQLNGLFIYPHHKKELINIYQNFTTVSSTPFDLMYSCKMLILNTSMSSELHLLARTLDLISQQHRNSRDFTAESLKKALREVIACFPVYRSYIRADKGKVHEEDRQYVQTAIRAAKRKNPATSPSLFDFIQSVLLLDHPSGLEEGEIADRENFVMHFQQLTSPIMAKGVEDTAFYRSYPLCSLREVGIDLFSFGTSVEAFHKKNQERLEFWPHTMNTTSTHDTKRSEDVRARINVLSEIPNEWQQALTQWSELNQPLKVVESDESIPDANEEYHFYQTLLGTWPLKPSDSNYVQRVQDYMRKSIREAKIHSSWINPNTEYENAVEQFINKVLSDSADHSFLASFKAFFPKIAAAGMLNSLSQVLLKGISPGVPDFYQGNEIWDFSLVDPDNRRDVDFSLRSSLLYRLQEKNVEHWMGSPEDGKIKLYITQKTLEIRKKYSELFIKGMYLPLSARGDKHNHIVAFAWTLGQKTIIVLAGRFFTFLMRNGTYKIEDAVWQDTQLLLPAAIEAPCFRNVFTGTELSTENGLNLAKVLSPLPIALLESMEES